MNNTSTKILQAVIVLIGIGTLAFLLWEPQVEGVNARASFFEIYFQDLLLAYAYIASIPFFVALYKAFTVLGDAGRHTILSPSALKSLRTIQCCAISMIPLIVGGVAFILLQPTDDRPPILMMGLILIVGSIIVATVARMFEHRKSLSIL